MSKYVSVREAAKLTGISPSVFNKLRVYGGGPPFLKIGRRVLYEVIELEGWLTSKRRSSTSQA